MNDKILKHVIEECDSRRGSCVGCPFETKTKKKRGCVFDPIPWFMSTTIDKFITWKNTVTYDTTRIRKGLAIIKLKNL